MQLYKYVSPNGIDIIQNLRLLVQNPNNFNDPFEFSFGVDDVKVENLSQQLKGNYGKELFLEAKKREGIDFNKFKKNISDPSVVSFFSKGLPESIHEGSFKFRKDFGDKDCGVICFSSMSIENTKEILLWSHYSSFHKGMRILFDTNKMRLTIRSKNLDKVKYVARRSIIDPLAFKFDIEKARYAHGNCFFEKSNVWNYENEFRWLINYREKKCHGEYDGAGILRRYINIDPQVIVKIDLGVHISPKLKEVISRSLKIPELSHVKCYQATLDRKEYKLNYEALN